MEVDLTGKTVGDYSANILDSLPPEIFYSVTTFLQGKALSSLMETLLGSKQKKCHSLMRCSIQRWQDDVVNFLSRLELCDNPQPAMLHFVQETLGPRTASLCQLLLMETPDASQIMLRFSEWCCTMDYIMLGPRTSKNAASGHMLWPIQIGIFTDNSRGTIPLQTRVVLSCPVWDPTAVVKSKHWLPENKNANTTVSKSFSWSPEEGDIDGFLPDENLAVIQPLNDTNIRTFNATKALARNRDDFSAMGQYYSYLALLPAVDCPVHGALVNHMIRFSRNAWLLGDQQISDKVPRMLCFFVEQQLHSSSEAHFSRCAQQDKGDLVEHILHLMQTLSKR